MGAADSEAVTLFELSRSELAAAWVAALRAAAADAPTGRRGRRRRWVAIGRDSRVRAVEREFVRRELLAAEEYELYVSARLDDLV